MAKKEDIMAVVGIGTFVVSIVSTYYQKKAYEVMVKAASLSGQGTGAVTINIFYLVLIALYILSLYLLLPKIKRLF